MRCEEGEVGRVAQYGKNDNRNEDYQRQKRYAQNKRENESDNYEGQKNHRQRVLREGLAEVSVQKRVEGAQRAATRAVETCYILRRAGRAVRRIGRVLKI